MNQKLTVKEDSRGGLMEVFKVPNAGQMFYVTSVPGATRGNHYHIRKKETYCVIEGKGKILMRDRKSGHIEEYVVSGEKPETIEIPVNWTHNIENIGEGEMKLLVWTNEIFNPDDPDTYPEKV